MAGRSVTRRQFLRRAGASTGAVAVGLGSVSALHQTHAQPVRAEDTEPLAMPGHGGPPGAQTSPAVALGQRPDAQYRAFFNDAQAQTVEAISERFWPGAPDKPGARDANVMNYIDLALAGAYMDLQDFYRRGLEAVDAHAQGVYGQPFRRLGPDQQDDTLRALERGEANTFTWPTAQAFFNLLWVHTIEGMFADPVYGGNHDFAGWRLIEFPGAQERFLRSDMQTDAKFTRAPILGLQQQYDLRTPRAGGD
jgi:gluconate 2-dehydrogenase gamma chain